MRNILNEYGLSEQEEKVRDWYDGFTFGKRRGIYNPWSIINYLDKRKFSAYWANTSSNSLVGKLIQEGNKEIKIAMEDLLKGKAVHAEIDEQIIFQQLDNNERAIFSLLLASGYLRVELRGRYVLSSNRESGFGRYDVMMEPLNDEDAAIILEFKVFDPDEEKTMEDTVRAALAQIEEKRYGVSLEERNIFGKDQKVRICLLWKEGFDRIKRRGAVAPPL